MMRKNENGKRRVVDENRRFNSEWEESFFFVDDNGRALCLLCNARIKHYKKYSLHRHHETHHPTFSDKYPPNSKLRSEKLASLKSNLTGQQSVVITIDNRPTRKFAEASYIMAWNIARAKRPYGEGEFIKKNLEDVVKALDPNNAALHSLVSQVRTSRDTIKRRITAINESLECSLKNDLRDCVAFSLALDDSTDITGVPQLAVFIRFVSPDLVVKEELLDLVALEESTCGVDIKNAFDSMMKNYDVPLHRLVSIATDEASATMVKKYGLIGLLTDDSQIPPFIPIHCIFHQEYLVTKYLKYPHVVKTVLHIVNYIRTSGKNHGQFRNFLEGLQDEELPNDSNFFGIVRWLSSCNVLNRFIDMFDPITSFLKEKGRTYPELEEDEWLQDLMFFTDVMEHLRTLNLKLQGKDKIISDLLGCIFSSHDKLRLFQNDIKSETFCYFPRIKKMCSNIKKEKLEEYIKQLDGILTEFQNISRELDCLRSSLNFFLDPFEINVSEVGFSTSDIIMTEQASGALELIDMQADLALQLKYKSITSITEFWKSVPESNYPELKKAACRIISMFGTTYLCESFYSALKFVKTKQRSVLTNQHVKELLRSAVTNYLPNFKDLSIGIK